jgi:hypothetical protein
MKNRKRDRGEERNTKQKMELNEGRGLEKEEIEILLELKIQECAVDNKKILKQL